ncbi:hypothetical protein B0A55_01006 [Friedmanniomyces simplex]|uniref:Ribosomal protein mS38 C-terminal domain-containing protein n=1 Tax=Friedmanniomyces simplex TaxID=329884 RepID=A0A4V5NIJ9_9PEZI|nr:hypothetical protein B0A55_01006 [Friedmanniomyces simplex]
MFSSKLTRVANRAVAPTVTTPSTCSALPRTATACLATRPSHQRRPSSSKTSCPPDSSKPGSAAKAAATTAADSAASSPTPEDVEAKPKWERIHRKSSSSSSSRVPRRRIAGPSLPERLGKQKEKLPAQQYPMLPSVPGVQHLHERDVGLTFFFSMHRPLAVTASVPSPSTTEAFNAIFHSHQHREDQWAHGDSARGSPEDVIYNLHSTIESLENSSSAAAAAAQDEGVRFEVLQESPSNNNDINNNNSIKHLDSPPRPKSLEEIVATFQPFHKPPPPQAFFEPTKPTTTTPRSSRKAPANSQAQQAKGTRSSTKTYQTTITVHEVTETNGQKSYRASSSPIISMEDGSVEAETGNHKTRTPWARVPVTSQPHPQHAQYPRGVLQPFRHRMLRRGRMYLRTKAEPNQMGGEEQQVVKERFMRRAPSEKRVSMMLISVKRQRKLKMKKHKYKKLMKRTRNLRRRLDRN